MTLARARAVELHELAAMLRSDLLRALHSRVTEALDRHDDEFIGFIFSWMALNHFFAAYWPASGKPEEKYGDGKALRHFSKQHEVVRIVGRLMQTPVGEVAVHVPVHNGWGEAVPTGRRGRVVARDLSVTEYFEILYAIRNKVLHGAKGPLSLVDKTNIAFGATQTRALVEQLAREAGIPL